MLEVVYHRWGVGSISVGDAVILDRKGFARANKAYLQGLEMMADASEGSIKG